MLRVLYGALEDVLVAWPFLCSTLAAFHSSSLVSFIKHTSTLYCVQILTASIECVLHSCNPSPGFSGVRLRDVIEILGLGQIEEVPVTNFCIQTGYLLQSYIAFPRVPCSLDQALTPLTANGLGVSSRAESLDISRTERQA